MTASSLAMLPFLDLDVLWLQLTGTVCNIACRHCFISCGPKVELHRILSLADATSAIDEAAAHGARELWLTGGEPLLHPHLVEVVAHGIERMAVGVLTNGMLITEPVARDLGRLFKEGNYNLEIRVSLDGPTPEANDRVRGRGVFAAAMKGIDRLVAHGIEPILAVSLVDGVEADREAFVDLLRARGIAQPRLRWIPAFRIGREVARARPYAPWEVLAAGVVDDPEVPWRLMCGTSRTVTSEGVFPCPMLINEPERSLGADLGDALRPHRVDHPACHTCWVEGFSCSA